MQVPYSEGTLGSLKWLGVTVGGKEYGVQDGALKLNHNPWRHGGNGNPPSMLDVVRSLLPHFHIVFLAERDINRNVAVYCVQESAPGVADVNKPMMAFWLMIPHPRDTNDLGDVYTEDLTTMEDSLAYGLCNWRCSDNVITTHVRAVSGQSITVRHDGEKWQAMIEMNSTPLVLHKFMIYTAPGKWTLWPRTHELHVEAEKEGRGISYHFAVP